MALSTAGTIYVFAGPSRIILLIEVPRVMDFANCNFNVAIMARAAAFNPAIRKIGKNKVRRRDASQWVKNTNDAYY